MWYEPTVACSRNHDVYPKLATRWTACLHYSVLRQRRRFGISASCATTPKQSEFQFNDLVRLQIPYPRACFSLNSLCGGPCVDVERRYAATKGSQSAPSCPHGEGAMLSYQTSCRHQMTFEGSPSHRICSVMNCAAVPTYGLPLWLARPATAKMATLGLGSMHLTIPS